MQIYDLWKETHPDYKTVHTPLFFRKIVGIEDFALRAAIFLGWVSKLLSGGGGGGPAQTKNDKKLWKVYQITH